MLFNGVDKDKPPFTLGNLDSHLIMVPCSLGPLESASPKRHLDLFSRFCTVRHCGQHTDTQTTLRVTSAYMLRMRRSLWRKINR